MRNWHATHSLSFTLSVSLSHSLSIFLSFFLALYLLIRLTITISSCWPSCSPSICWFVRWSRCASSTSLTTLTPPTKVHRPQLTQWRWRETLWIVTIFPRLPWKSIARPEAWDGERSMCDALIAAGDEGRETRQRIRAKARDHWKTQTFRAYRIFTLSETFDAKIIDLKVGDHKIQNDFKFRRHKRIELKASNSMILFP